MLHGGNIVVRALEDMGVEVVFGVPGEHTAFFYDAVSRSSKLHHVLMRDECHCVCAADAYARASRKLGVCDSTVGPGSSKLVSGLAEAYNSSTAILAIVGGYRFETSHFIGKGRVSQGISQEDYLKPVCKKVFTVNCAEQLYDVIRHAAVCACTGVCGPVAVIISTDIFSERRLTPPEHNVPCPKAVFPMFPVTAPRESIREASGLIAGASRPVFLAGGGVMGSGAERILSDLAERFVIPIATSFSGTGAVREDHPLCLGFSGKMGIPTNEKLLRKSDLIILVGTKAGENTS